jgi:hypothetical protein
MMYAAEAAYENAPDSAIVEYASRLVQGILSDASYRNSRFCTPIACRGEACLVYLRLLRHAGLSGSGLTAQVRHQLVVNLSLQLSDRLHDGAFCRGGGSRTVRIDYLQHNLMAFLGASEFVGELWLRRSVCAGGDSM